MTIYECSPYSTEKVIKYTVSHVEGTKDTGFWIVLKENMYYGGCCGDTLETGNIESPRMMYADPDKALIEANRLYDIFRKEQDERDRLKEERIRKIREEKERKNRQGT
jgi:hypothetical protein